MLSEMKEALIQTKSPETEKKLDLAHNHRQNWQIYSISEILDILAIILQ